MRSRRRKLFLNAAVVTVGAGQVGIEFAAGVGEIEAFRGQRLELRALALRDDRVTRGTVARAHGLAERGLVFVVVAAETAGPVLVADVVRVNAPVGLAFGEDRRGENLLHRGNRAGDFGRERGVGVFR